jgi:recombination protein RecT
VGYFAHIEMLNGFAKTLYMSKEQVTAHAKKYSKSFSNPNTPWTKEFDAMAIKTVLRNLLSHYGFLSVEMATAMSSDIESDSVTDEVNGRIRENANRETMAFDDAEVLDENKEPQEINPI